MQQHLSASFLHLRDFSPDQIDVVAARSRSESLGAKGREEIGDRSEIDLSRLAATRDGCR